MASWGRSIYENMNRKEEGESAKDFIARKRKEKEEQQRRKRRQFK